MASSLNKVSVIGNVGREPELRYTPDGTPTTKFSVASNRTWNTPEGEKREETEWFNVVTWRDLADKCSAHVTKGQKVYVEGRLQTRKWTDPQGVEKRFTDLIAYRVVILWKARSMTNGDEGAAPMDLEDIDESGNSGLANSLNCLMMIGTLTKDAETQHGADGSPRTTFTIAVKRGWKTPDGEQKEETELVSVVAFKKLAETLSNNLSKGQKVYVEGRMQTRKWTDQEGVERHMINLVANQVVFPFKPRVAAGDSGFPNSEPVAAPPEEGEESGEEIPF
jgi:single-strand DNA-binding protein